MSQITLTGELAQKLSEFARQHDTDIEILLMQQLANLSSSLPEPMKTNAAEQLELVAQAAHLGIWVLDMATGHLEWNNQLLEIYGITRYQFENELDSWRNSVHPDDKEFADRRLSEAFDGRSVVDVPFRIIRPDGEIRHINAAATPIFDDNGTVIRVIGNNLDVTHLKHTEQTLAQQAEILSSISEAVIITDPAFKIISWNEQATQMYGWEASEVIGKNMSDVTPTTYTDTTDSSVRRAFSETGKWQGEAIQQTKSSEDLYILSTVNTLYDEHQQPIGFLAINRDITARKRAENLEIEHQKMGLQLQKEKEITRLRSQMLQTLAHEYRMPLSIIMTSIELLMRYRTAYSDEEAQRHADKIIKQINILNSFIEEMQSFALAEHSFLEPTMQPASIAAICDDVIDDMRPILKPNQVIETDFEQGLPQVLCDGRLLQLALSNLISNAIKYSPPQSVIKLELSRMEGHIQISIEDQGIGIPQEDHETLFEPFQRASNVQKYNGTGLGLSIVHNVIEKHQGTITFTSTVGEGTCFVMLLPYNPHHPQ